MGFARELYSREYFTGRDARGNKLNYGAVGADEWAAGGISAIHRNLIDQFPLVGARVLEIGYGRAESARYLLSTGKAADYIGVDFSKAAHSLARGTLKDIASDRWAIHCDDALPFMERHRFSTTFDAILMLDVIEHIPQSEVHGLLPLLFAAMAPGGYLIVNTPFYSIDEDYIAQNYEYIMPSASDLLQETRGMHCNKYTEQRLQREFTDAGFFRVGPTLFRRAPVPGAKLKCAVVTPVGPGHEALFRQAMASVQTAAQTDPGPFTEFDCIAIDDTAGTKGRSAARNEGVLKAAERGADWLFFLDADDLMTRDAFRQMAPHIDRADAVWGLILEAAKATAEEGEVIGHIRLPQLPRITGLPDLLLHDPYVTLQMGHFVRTSTALAHPFEESMDVGEDVHYYLRVWADARCVKIPTPLFLNRRGLHSTGARAADGGQWRQAVEKVIADARATHGVDPESLPSVDHRNAATRDTRTWQRGFGAVNPDSLLSISRQFPFHGFLEIEPRMGEPFVLFDDNDDLVCMTVGWRGGYEPASTRLWQALASDASLIFDIGAYSGVYTLLAARAAPEARIVAVEPVAANFQRLVKNLEANGCDRATAVQAAVADRSGTITLSRAAARDFLTSGASITRPDTGDGLVQESVPAVTGAELLASGEGSSVELIKIDVEGAEEQVLAGMSELLGRCHPDLLIECLGATAADRVDGILRPLGYRFFTVDDDALTLHPSDRFVAATGMASLNRWATIRNTDSIMRVARDAGLSVATAV